MEKLKGRWRWLDSREMNPRKIHLIKKGYTLQLG